MGGTRRITLASAAVFAIAMLLVGCSGVGTAPTLPNAEADGEVIGNQAAAPTPTATPTPQYSVNSAWTDTTGCPPELFAGISEGMAAGGTVNPTTPSAASGPTSMPALAAGLVPSCSFTFTSAKSASLGLVGRGEIFIGMGETYDTLFTYRIVGAGFHKNSTVNGTTLYARGRSVVGVTYIPPNTDGEPYSIVAVLGVN